jgi:cyclohexadienyl dehydratase
VIRAFRVLAAAALGLAAPAGAETPRTLRVGTSGDYAPFSVADAGEEPRFEGFDPALVRRFADENGLALEWVRFAWPELEADLAAGRFDVAAGGVTVRPERSLAGRFTVPVARSGALALVPGDAPYRSVEDLRTPGVRIGVNAGGHLEKVARARFPHATLLAIPGNDHVLPALLEGSVEAVVTDDLEAPGWLARAPGHRTLGPFSRDRKAWLVRADRPELARDLDAWLLAREANGTLDELREEQLGPGAAKEIATPLRALLAAFDERLELMPLVARAKRARGLPVRDAEQEQRVLDAATKAARDAARRAGVLPIPDRWVQALFRAQIEAGAALQERALARPDVAGGRAHDLDAELRPALARIGERIAECLARLPGPLDPGAVEREADDELDAPGLDAATREKLADVIAQVSRYRAQ